MQLVVTPKAQEALKDFMAKRNITEPIVRIYMLEGG